MSSPMAPSPRNPAKRTRGRRIVLWLVGLYLAAQGLAGYLIDHHGLAIRFPAAATVLHDAEESPKATVVWMGSSRSGALSSDAINTGLWERYGRHRVNLFNAAVPGGDPVTSEFLLDALLERGHRPEIIVVEVCPYFLLRNSNMVGMHVLRQTNWSDVPAILPEAVSTGNLVRLLTARLLPLYLHRKAIRSSVLPANPPATRRSASAEHPRDPHLRDAPEVPTLPDLPPGRVEFDPTNYAPKFRDYRADGVVSAALARLLSRCHAEGISVTLLSPPVSEKFRALYTPEVDRRFQDELARMRRIHPFEFVELRDALPEGGFGDPLHLTELGGLHYTRTALERVVVPAVERRGLVASP